MKINGALAAALLAGIVVSCHEKACAADRDTVFSHCAVLERVPWTGDGKAVREGAAWYDEDRASEFKAEFVLPEGVDEAKITFACAGFASIRLGDGTAVTDESGLDTLWSVYDKTVYVYTPAPVKARAYPALNTVYVRLGNGFYNIPPLRFWGGICFRSALARGRPCFKLSIEGVEKPLEWKWRETDVMRNSVYLGTEVDATKPEDKVWKSAVAVAGPKGALVRWPRSEPVTGEKEVLRGRPLQAREGAVQVFDFGVNASGVPRFVFNGEARGTRVEIVYGERLNADGTVNVLTQTAGQIKRKGMGGPGAPDLACQRDVYVCSGAAKETFSPPFTWHIFRYAEIRGAKNPVSVAENRVMSMVSLKERKGGAKAFKTADKDLQAIHELCLRTFQANLIGGVQSDCPGRERLGYGGDIVASCRAYMLNFDMHDIYLKILRDFVDEAADDGWITETAPFVGIADRGFGGRSGPVSWTLAVPELMDAILSHYGDKRVLGYYPVCTRYIKLVDAKCPDGIIAHCIGDHEALERAPDAVTATAHWYRFVKLTASFARRLGKEGEAKELEALAAKIRSAFAAKFVKDDGTVANGTQSAQAIAFYLGLAPDALRARVFARLVEAVEKKGCAPHTGIFSTRYMLMALSENGRPDLARKIVLHKGFPGWLHMIDRGATTLWETWKESDDIYSNCHPMFGSVDEWILKYADAAGCAASAAPAKSGERVEIWPEGKMPDRQPHQIAAMIDEKKPGTEPYLEWFAPPARPNGGCVVLIPGGGYARCSSVKLVKTWNEKFTAAGFQCVKFVYRTPRPEKPLEFYKSAWQDGQRAVRIVRSEAAKRGFSPDKIGVIGMSAGSHLSALLATSSLTPAYGRIDAVDDVPCNVNWAITGAIAYALTDGLGTPNTRGGQAVDVKLDDVFRFDAKTAPMCMFHGSDDNYSPIASTMIYRELRKRKIPAELHLFADRPHAFWGEDGKGDKAAAYDTWFDRAHEFLVQMGFLGKLPAQEDIMKRYAKDFHDVSKYSKENLWPEGKTPDFQKNHCTPYLEWYIPAKLTTKAVQIIYSGGAYYGNGPDSFEVAPARRYLNEKGMAVVTMRYRSPRPLKLAKHTCAWQDLQRCIRIVRSKAASKGLDPERIGIMGSSAGGHLTLMGVTSSRSRSYWNIDETDAVPCNVQWGVGIYPAYALTDGADKFNTSGGNDDSAVLVPEFAFDPDTCPMVFIHGDADVWAAMNSVKTWEQMRRMGVKCDLHTLCKRPHCFQNKASPGTGSYTWLDRIWEFMNHKGYNR